MLRIFISFVIIIFMVSYVSAQFVGGGKAFAASFQMNYTTGVLITAAIVLLYTIMGGFLAVSFTDMFQAFLMIFALVLLPVIVIGDRGGLGIILTELKSIDASMVDPFSLSIGAGIGLLGIGASLGPTSILALYSKKTTRAGIFAGVTVGALTTIIWRYTPFLKAIIYELVPAFLLGALATYLVSMFTKAPDNVDELFKAMEK